MKSKIGIAALFVAMFVLLPYTGRFQERLDWRYDPANYPKMVGWSGCHATVYSDPDVSPLGSYYNIAAHVLVIGAKEDAEVPYYAGLFILFHETAHCLQHESGWLDTHMDSLQTVELDADRGASDLACGLGLDGRKINRDTFEWAKEKFGYQGDPWHGSIEQREAMADQAHRCDKIVQSPFSR